MALGVKALVGGAVGKFRLHHKWISSNRQILVCIFKVLTCFLSVFMYNTGEICYADSYLSLRGYSGRGLPDHRRHGEGCSSHNDG